MPRWFIALVCTRNEQTTTMTTTKNLTTATATAHTIRRELATEHGVPVRYINFGDCIRAAEGRRSKKLARNCWGHRLGSNLEKLDRTLLCDAEVPTFWFVNDIAERTGIRASTLGAYIYDLAVAGRLNNDGQLYSVRATARPFPQPALAFA